MQTQERRPNSEHSGSSERLTVHRNGRIDAEKKISLREVIETVIGVGEQSCMKMGLGVETLSSCMRQDAMARGPFVSS